MNYWSDKRVACIGGAGFMGSHVVERLLEVGAVVYVLDNYSRGHNFITGAEYVAVGCDASNAAELSHCLSDFKPDVVLNLAASVAGVLWNQKHNADMFASNIALQTVPVQVCAELQVPRFVQVSSVCVYAPEYAAGAIEENGMKGEPVAANNGYAWAKRMGERVALWSDLPSVSIVRPSNMYGPRDYFDERAHVIPALIKKCLNDDVIKVHGTGNEVREFLYVEDAARGLLDVAEHGKHREAYNLGTNGKTRIRISDLIEGIREYLDADSKPIEFTGGDAGDSERWSNCEKAMDRCGFSSHVGLFLGDGLSKTIEWYQSARVTA